MGVQLANSIDITWVHRASQKNGPKGLPMIPEPRWQFGHCFLTLGPSVVVAIMRDELHKGGRSRYDTRHTFKFFATVGIDLVLWKVVWLELIQTWMLQIFNLNPVATSRFVLFSFVTHLIPMSSSLLVTFCHPSPSTLCNLHCVAVCVSREESRKWMKTISQGESGCYMVDGR